MKIGQWYDVRFKNGISVRTIAHTEEEAIIKAKKICLKGDEVVKAAPILNLKVKHSDNL